MATVKLYQAFTTADLNGSKGGSLTSPESFTVDGESAESQFIVSAAETVTLLASGVFTGLQFLWVEVSGATSTDSIRLQLKNNNDTYARVRLFAGSRLALTYPIQGAGVGIQVDTQSTVSTSSTEKVVQVVAYGLSNNAGTLTVRLFVAGDA
jgi:hypothetical protein